jgi:imidazolonepropionase
MYLIHNAAQLVTVTSGGEKLKRGKKQGEISLIENGSVLIDGDKIRWTGRAIDFNFKLYDNVKIFDASGRVVLPGLIDPHTHLIFAGTRADEFALRISGYTYQEIAKMGGGIMRTVNLTRKASRWELVRIAEKYLNIALKNGTTTVEVKSGYGLDFENEIKILEVAEELSSKGRINIIPTFLGAHAIPPEYTDRRESYIHLVISMLPDISHRKLAKFCDVFCEDGYFSPVESEKILTEARKCGLSLKIHAEQFSNYGGTKIGVKLGAVSIDHLENISDSDIEILSKSNSIAVLLPGVSFFLNYKYPPARKLIDSGVPIAIGTDFNPGSCMSLSMQLMMTIACTQMRMTIEEVIVASTLNSASALGISNIAGSIEPGKRADLVIFDVPDYRMIPYFFGESHVCAVFVKGRMVFPPEEEI